MQQLVNDLIPTGNELRSSFAQLVGKVVYKSTVMEQLPGTGGRPHESPTHIQEVMGARELIGYPQGAALEQAPLMAPTKPEGGHEDRLYISRFSIYSMVPPATDPHMVLERADDVSAILRMLSEPQTNAVILSGEPGAGKSTLAALLYHHLQDTEADQSAVGAINRPLRGGIQQNQQGAEGEELKRAPLPLRFSQGFGSLASLRPPRGDRGGDRRGSIRHFVWLSLGPNATLPDVIAAMLSGINMGSDDFFFLKPEQQMALLVQALGRPQESAFIVLDQFEELLNPERAEMAETSSPSPMGLPGRGAIGLFFETLRDADIGTSSLLLTSYRSLNGSQNGQESHIRSYLVSRISIPEGVALLGQRGVAGSHSELSLVWQRCGGHVFALVLFSVLTSLSGFSLSYLLNSPDCAPMWNGEVTRNLIGTIYYYLNPIQRTLMRALCLFAEPVPLDAIATAIMGENEVSRPEGPNGSPFMTFKRELSALVEMFLVQEQSKGIGQHTYFLHSLLRHYTVEHYLEGSDPGRGRFSVPTPDISALGVAAPPNPMVRNPEARQIALAAGHMRVAAYYARLAQEFCPPRKERTGLWDVEPILAMIQHLCHGWHWQEAYNLLRAEGLDESMLQWGALDALTGLYTAMLPPLGMLSRSDFGEICGQLGLLYGRLGDDAQSRAYYEQALAVFREVGDGYAEAVTLANEGELFRSMGEWEKARSNFEQALMLNRQYGDKHVQSVVMHNLGLLFQATKDYTRALHYYVDSLKVAHSLKEPYNEGMILSNIGFLMYEQAHLPEAIALLSYAVQVRQSLHDPGVSAVIDFLNALEQKMGPEAFAHVRSAAAGYNLETHDLISRLLNSGTR